MKKHRSVVAATVLAAGFFGVAPQAQGIVENSGDVSVRPTTGEEAIASAPADTGNDASVRDAVYLSERSPVVDGVGGLTEDEVREAQDIARRTVETPAESTYVPGEMWSDTVGLPQGVEKGAADEAEVAVATTEVERAPYRTLFAAANEFRGADCQRYPFVQMAVCGQIKDLYNQLGGVTSWLLWPEEPVSVNPDGRGFRQKFRNGFIYWSPESGAHSVNVDSARTWSENGWEAGYLGYPTAEETAVKTTTGIIGVDGTVHGWVQKFQGGRIYRMRGLGWMRAAAVTGAIYDRWQALGGVDSDLGLPISSEAVAKDGVGRYSVFEGGVIYWHPQFGAWEVKGLPLLLWKLKGGVNSAWGYPTGSSEKKEGWTELQNFSKGRLDTLAEFIRAKSTIVGGKEVNSLVVELFPETVLSSNINLNTGVHNYSTYLLPETPNDGGVSIPPGYDYKGPNSGETLADFCTNSPDQFPNPVGKNADFRGACARHDLCYSGAKEISWGETFGWTRDNERVTKPQAARYRHCNSRLGTDMNTVCRNVYSESYKTQFYCIDTAAVYETAVTAAHAEHYFPVVNGQVMTGYIGEY